FAMSVVKEPDGGQVQPLVTSMAGSGEELSGDSGGYQRCELIAGAGGLSNPLLPDGIAQGAVIFDFLHKILAGTGQTLSVNIIPSLLSSVRPQWSWSAGSVRDALSALAQHLGLIWRVWDDGLVWLGAPNPQPVTAPDYIGTDLAPEAAQQSLLLGDNT